MKLDDVPAYRRASALSDYVWNIVIAWDTFAKFGLGRQFTDSVDSIGANISEGFGRYYKKDKVRTFYTSRGEVFESNHWCKKAFKRNLITSEQYDYIMGELRVMPKEINYLIKITSSNLTI